MDKSAVITLVRSERVQDELLQWETVETTREVFCQVDSVTASEFFEGGRNGLNPEYRFRVFFGDYDGEDIVIYDGKRYGVYRTYKERGDTIELYVERQGGVNGQE